MSMSKPKPHYFAGAKVFDCRAADHMPGAGIGDFVVTNSDIHEIRADKHLWRVNDPVKRRAIMRAVQR